MALDIWLRATQITSKETCLPLYSLFFPVSNKGSFINTIPQTGEHIPRLLSHQSWSTDRTRNILMGPVRGMDSEIHSTLSGQYH